MLSPLSPATIERHNRYQRDYYESRQKRTMLRTDSFYVRDKISWMVHYAALDRGHEVLEVGAGLGKFSIPLLRQGYGLTCLDLSPVMLADLRGAAPAGARLDTIAADILDVADVTDRRFDRVIGFFVLHHLVDLDRTFQTVAAVLKPGGIATFLEPAASNPLYYLQITFTPGMTWRAERGLLMMRAGKVQPAMPQAGLVDLESTSFGLLPPFAANTRIGQAIEERIGHSLAARPAAAFRLFRGRRQG